MDSHTNASEWKYWSLGDGGRNIGVNPLENIANMLRFDKEDLHELRY